MFFVAVLYSIYSRLTSAASPAQFVSFTRSKYGEETLLTFRKVEKLSLKLQKSKCDLEFIRLCIIYQLTPTFLHIKMWKKRIKRTNEFKQFQQHCLKNEFKTRHADSIKYEKQIKPLMENLSNTMQFSDFNKLQKYLFERSKELTDKTTRVHEKKLTKLNGGPVGQNFLSLKNKLIHNLSSHELSPTEERILSRGWDFCIETKLNNTIDLKTDIEQNIKKLESSCHHNSTFSSICNEIGQLSSRLIKQVTNKRIRNISDDEYQALMSLKKNRNIIICKADKGNCIVLLNKEDYIEKANEILNKKQFMKTTKSLLEEKEKHLNQYILKLSKEKIIDKKLYWRLHSTSSTLATMYGQPKVHKNNYPLRPIISSIGSYNYELAKYLAELIKNNLRNEKEKSSSFVKDSFDFVKRITGLSNVSKHTMISFDVDNLYTNVPVSEAIEITLDLLFEQTDKPDLLFDREQMKHLLEIAVCNVPFRFLNNTYIQRDGVAMGSPLGPILADIFMCNLEKKLNRFTKNKPLIWMRYVDDIFCIFTGQQNINDFFNRINKWHSHISFTKETEVDQKLAFLDVLVTRDVTTDKYTTTIYRKPTNTNLYLLYESNQCRRYKIGLIRTLTIRILLICSTQKYITEELKTMKQTLINNGYPEHLIKRGIKQGEITAKRIKDNTKIEKKQEKALFLTFSYYGNESAEFAKKVKKICKRFLPLFQINIAFRKTLTIKRIFLPIQKGIDEHKKDKKVIYKIKCNDCDKVYIGETSRNKSTRMKEHSKDIKNFSDNSNIAKHVNEQKHSFNIQEAETLNIESNWTRRIIKESLYTQQHHKEALNDVKFKLNIFR